MAGWLAGVGMVMVMAGARLHDRHSAMSIANVAEGLCTAATGIGSPQLRQERAFRLPLSRTSYKIACGACNIGEREQRGESLRRTGSTEPLRAHCKQKRRSGLLAMR